MRLEGTLHQLTGDGCLAKQDLETEWQHKLKTTSKWQEKTDHMGKHQKETFFRIERHLFIEGIHDAFARAQAKLEWQAKLGSQAKMESQAKPKPDHLEDLEVALVEFQYDRLRELDGFPQELPQGPPQELPRVPETFVQQPLTPKEYEALALAMFQQYRMRKDTPDAVEAASYRELSKEKCGALALAMVEEEHKQWQSKKRLLRKESRRRKSEQKMSERKAIEAAGQKSDAEQKRAKIEKAREARKALKARQKTRRAREEEGAGRNHEARQIEQQAREIRQSQAEAALSLQEEQRREARETEEQTKAEEQAKAEKKAKAKFVLLEELARQHKKAKKKRAISNRKDERNQRIFGFRYFPTEKVRARAQKELKDIKVS
jgi:hypothetical protein